MNVQTRMVDVLKSARILSVDINVNAQVEDIKLVLMAKLVKVLLRTFRPPHNITELLFAPGLCMDFSQWPRGFTSFLVIIK